MEKQSIEFSIKSNLENVSSVGEEVRQLCSDSHLTAAESSPIELCAVEAVTNSIRHAYKLKPDNEVHISLSISPEKLNLVIKDTGESMDPAYFKEQLNNPNDFDPNDIENLPVGGMGIIIMKETMDEVTYETKGHENILTMTKTFNVHTEE